MRETASKRLIGGHTDDAEEVEEHVDDIDVDVEGGDSPFVLAVIVVANTLDVDDQTDCEEGLRVRREEDGRKTNC